MASIPTNIPLVTEEIDESRVEGTLPSDEEREEEEEEKDNLQDAYNQLYVHSINILKRLGITENKNKLVKMDIDKTLETNIHIINDF
ncbi:hypothetical protein PJP07_30685, partial [Mycobacterium kansasii]